MASAHHHHHGADDAHWADHARQALAARGGRASAVRDRVVAALDAQECCASAQEIHDRVRRDGASVGIASVYRTLDLLHGLGLVTRVDTGDGVARYEPIQPDGAHHHHLVCTRCGSVDAFQDDALEQAIHRVADRVDFEVTGHDVALRGVCGRCR